MIRPTAPGPTGPIEATAVDVVVVGGGPVGLAMALDLGSRGVKVLLVDAGTGVINYPTAESIDVRTMEWLRSLGHASAVDESGFPAEFPRDIAFVTTMSGSQIARFERPSNGARRATTGGQSVEGAAWWPKFWFDTALRDRASRLDEVTLRYRWRCVNVTQDESGVEVELQHVDGDRRTVSAQYVVGCDGGNSNIRTSSGIEMSGTAREARWQGALVQIDGLLSTTPFAPAVQYYVLAPRRLILGSLDGASAWRVTYPLLEGEKPSEADVRATIEEALGELDVSIHVHDTRPWAGNSIVADSFRAGRVFLAGDSAHQMWPSGGHGMNTGIGDVANLGWKLALAVRGYGGPALLDSYTAERHPVARRNVARAASNYAADIALPSGADLLDPGDAGRALRRRAAVAVHQTRATEWQSLGVQLGFRYDSSAIVAAPGGPEPADDLGRYEPVVRPGHRAPHAMVGDAPLIDATGAGFSLLSVDANVDTGRWVVAFQERGVALTILEVPATGPYGGFALVLVRPDGMVGWASRTAEMASWSPDVVADLVLGLGNKPEVEHQKAAQVHA